MKIFTNEVVQMSLFQDMRLAQQLESYVESAESGDEDSMSLLRVVLGLSYSDYSNVDVLEIGKLTCKNVREKLKGIADAN